jgi:divalent metal cation (Fe/Co/Zn/Cd) transporter
MTSATPSSERSALVRHAFVLEWFTIGWMTVEAAVAIASAIASHSITLAAFGLDSVIELASAGVLIWRLSVEVKQGREFSETAEERASKIAGALLYALALYVIASSLWSLFRHEGAAFSLSGLLVALVAIPTMYMLSKAKIRVADALGSRALRADAVEAITCGFLSIVVVVGILAQLMFRAWWVDGLTSLAIVYLLVKEGREAWAGEDCCDD